VAGVCHWSAAGAFKNSDYNFFTEFEHVPWRNKKEKNMPPELLPVIIFPSLFAAIAYVVKVVSDNRTRRQLIASGASQDVIDALFLQPRAPDYEIAKRNGYVGLGVGIAFCIIAVAGFGPGDAISYGLLALGFGAALVIYYRSRVKD
jgi:hypothetical protein